MLSPLLSTSDAGLKLGEEPPVLDCADTSVGTLPTAKTTPKTTTENTFFITRTFQVKMLALQGG